MRPIAIRDLKSINIILLAAFLIIGCKGPKGDQGSSGPAGPPGNPGEIGDIQTFDGAVTSNDFTVTVPVTNEFYNVTVYLGDGVDFSELPYFLPGFGVNAYFLGRIGQIQIVNAALAGATAYRILIVSPAASSDLSLYERLTGS